MYIYKKTTRHIYASRSVGSLGGVYNKFYRNRDGLNPCTKTGGLALRVRLYFVFECVVLAGWHTP